MNGLPVDRIYSAICTGTQDLSLSLIQVSFFIKIVNPYDIISILLETLIYGAFFVLFILSTTLLLYRRKHLLREDAGLPLRTKNLTFYLVMSVLMFCTTTAKWSFYWPEVFPIPGREAIPPQIPRLSQMTYILKEACIQATVILGDLIIIHRLWILTNKSKMTVTPPICGLFAFLTCSISLDGPFNNYTSTSTTIPVNVGSVPLTQWDVATTAITLSITVYVTVMISWTILKTQCRAGVRLGYYAGALGLIAESAAISATWNLLFFIADLGFNSRVAVCLRDCLPAIYGISAMLINVRVGLGCFKRNAADTGVTPRETEHGGYISTMVLSLQLSSGAQESLVEQGRGTT